MNPTTKRIVAVLLALVLIALSLGLFGWWGLNSSIHGFYHPNAVEGNYGQKYLWVFELILLGIALFALYTIIWGKVETRIKSLGIAFVVLLAIYASVSVFNFILRNYHAEYYIGQQKYSIP